MAYTYIEAIGAGFPTVQAHSAGDLYTDLVWDAGDPLPSQETLDSWILSNPQRTSTKITVLAFRNRFTQAEKVAIDLSSIDNPAAAMSARQLAASLRVMASDLTVATFVDLDRPDTRAGVQALETYGIIGAGRASIILDTPPTALELSPH
jgi:hypothetical protein